MQLIIFLSVIVSSFCLATTELCAQVQEIPSDTVTKLLKPDSIYSGVHTDNSSKPDSLKKLLENRPGRHSPSKAAWRSAVLPGWGQVYNDKYWKLPLVYGGLGGLGYWIYFNADQHSQYRNAIIALNDDDSTTINPFGNLESTLINTREIWRRQLDISIIFFAAFYGLQIVDAIVDAHLYEFDVSDDLSIKWNPQIDPFRYRDIDGSFSGFYGLNLQLQFGP